MFVAERRSLRDRRIDRRRVGGHVSPDENSGDHGNHNQTRAEFQHENLLRSEDLSHDA
jgi:hypothetical protein